MSELYRNIVQEARIRNLVRQAMVEHNSPEAMRNYLKEHPGADPKNHTVKKTDGGESKSDSGSSNEGDLKGSLSKLKGLEGKELKKGISSVRKSLDNKRKDILQKRKDLESEKKLSDQAIYAITIATKSLQLYDKKLAEIGRKGKGDIEGLVEKINKALSSADKQLKSGPPKPKEKPKKETPKSKEKEAPKSKEKDEESSQESKSDDSKKLSKHKKVLNKSFKVLDNPDTRDWLSGGNSVTTEDKIDAYNDIRHTMRKLLPDEAIKKIDKEIGEDQDVYEDSKKMKKFKSLINKALKEHSGN